ncbi:bifunctional 2-C-methyl-D-erythritol 4-phosphate cytidylyltransferase/2-C-methyl-D-erythritol 2,4-cyclodiphosphate synthase [Saccharibacter sp. 17.LH.SD]|uniref:bifunctional 2-C-methyl-D-erythritol 4-phosphate cytidylyltransferase/2-C-methyl-D-erythritol 2,4-cyclodiphosphate synthase n=1 Tax=Saccharibacter sp. 17.LH.SD TaxID=2689393 RepID=UPI00136CF410|nr:bifunctional 2-C-methyl-D-erythritol 4-phosphate cytidylyltransferase/2-C-methyl-D-erythritol 2,4-cyclodiphosphate synthase [Saccharibacter sp. 17.LH.SD]
MTVSSSSSPRRVAALLLAAGRGRRFAAGASDAAISKQFQSLQGQPVIRHAARALLPYVDVLQPVGNDPLLEEALSGLDVLPPVEGGAERHDSVRAGLDALAALPNPPDIVLVHDGARPVVPGRIIQDILTALETHQGVIPALPVSDTLKKVSEDIITATVPRADLWRAQTPQGFHFPLLRDLHHRHSEALTDDAGLLEREGHHVAIVMGSEDNIKLTVTEDLMRLERIVDHNKPTMLPRVGHGYDVHAFAEGRKLILCGIEIPHDRGLAGHSDADVGIHTLCDAIYGALAEGDIGRHFPPSDNQWRDMDSARFLIHAGDLIRSKGGMLVNADITIICEAPKIGPHAQAMRARLAELLRVKIDRISVKATTSERLGFTGRQEGIAATATVSIMVPDDGEE